MYDVWQNTVLGVFYEFVKGNARLWVFNSTSTTLHTNTLKKKSELSKVKHLNSKYHNARVLEHSTSHIVVTLENLNTYQK